MEQGNHGVPTSFRESLRDHQLRHIDLVLQKVGDDLLYILLRGLDVTINQELVQAGLDHSRHESTVVSSDSLLRVNVLPDSEV